MTTPKEFQTAAEKAAAKADQDLAGEASRLPAPTWEQLRDMLPETQDQEQLDEMMEIVNQDTSHNEKVAALLGNADRMADVVVKVMEKFR